MKKIVIFTAYFLHLFAVNAVNRGELFFFTGLSVAVNYFFHRLMRLIIFFTAYSGEKKIINRLRESGEKKIIHRFIR